MLLRRYRCAAALTQEELAERAHLSLRSVGNLERGAAQRPRRHTLALLASALELSPELTQVFLAAAREIPAGSEQPLPASPLPLIGRVEERALLEGHLRARTPPMFVICGAPGIGKTRLLREAANLARHQGLPLLEGGCSYGDGREPFEPILRAVQQFLGGLARPARRDALRGCAWLVRLLPELAGDLEPLPAWTVPPAQERRLILAAVIRFLIHAAETGHCSDGARVVLLLDDLQWAGSEALDLLGDLVCTAGGLRGASTIPGVGHLPLCILATYRDSDVRSRDPLSQLLANLGQARLIAWHRLDPLSDAESAQLLHVLLSGEHLVDADERKRLLRRAGGLPFYLVSCAELASGTGGSEHGMAVPWTVAQSIRCRVAALPEVAREIVECAAILGREVPLALLMTCLHHSAEEVVQALEAAGHAHLLEEVGGTAPPLGEPAPSGCLYRFPHEIIREVIEGDMSGGRRLLLQELIGTALK